MTRVLQIMVEHRIRSVIVLNSRQKLVGIIAREDVIAALKATACD
ncbi:CBS domain-containing protein [Bradyrhizobium sp. F1.2.2]